MRDDAADRRGQDGGREMGLRGLSEAHGMSLWRKDAKRDKAEAEIIAALAKLDA